jgi:hypothetical protein
MKRMRSLLSIRATPAWCEGAEPHDRIGDRDQVKQVSSICEERAKYRHILIPTDGSELAQKAVINGLPPAKSVGAKR